MIADCFTVSGNFVLLRFGTFATQQALFGRHAESELIPECVAKRKSANHSGFMDHSLDELFGG
jgi:hypothetical protein